MFASFNCEWLDILFWGVPSCICARAGVWCNERVAEGGLVWEDLSGKVYGVRFLGAVRLGGRHCGRIWPVRAGRVEIA